jgi:hypothetical protein
MMHTNVFFWGEFLHVGKKRKAMVKALTDI